MASFTITPPPCHYGSSCYRKNPEHLLQYSHPNKLPNPLPSIPAQIVQNCVHGDNCQKTNPEHFKLFSHPKGPCHDGEDCISKSIAHGYCFTHTDSQMVEILKRNITDQVSGSTNSLAYSAGILPHKDLQKLYNLTTSLQPANLFANTGFSLPFFKAAFLHGALVASKQLKTLTQTIRTNTGSDSIENLHTTNKIKFIFGPSQDAIKKVTEKVKSEHREYPTLAPLANPKDGFKWEETIIPKGVCQFDKTKGLHLLTGGYHSTKIHHAQSIFKEVAMVSGGYLGKGMYFTIAPTEDAKASDLDAVLKTSTYGLFEGGVIVIALVLGFKGIKYVDTSNIESPNKDDWDLKYLPPGIKTANYGNRDEKNRGAAELVATDPAQVLPLGLVYIENAALSLDEQNQRDELIKTIAANEVQLNKMTA